MRLLSQLRLAQAIVKIRPGPGESVKLTGKMVRTANDATTGGGNPGGNEGRPHMPLAGVATVFTELSRIKSVIGIKYSKMKIFSGGWLQGGKSGGSYPQNGG
jgi:hypothetical protein